jgi:CelD/BcsL family acetyltransferase involved in cellulose biosynthesis
MLDLHGIEDAFGRGLRCVDFMRGVGHYKDHYRSESHFNQELLIFRNSRARLHYRLADQVARKMDGLRRRLEWKRQTILGTD